MQGDGLFTIGSVAKDVDDGFTVLWFTSGGTLDTTFGNAGRTDIADFGDSPSGGVLVTGSRIIMTAQANLTGFHDLVTAYFTGNAAVQRVYAEQDANDDTTSLISTSGTVL